MEDNESERVHPLMVDNFKNVLSLSEKAGQMGADLVRGPEDMNVIPCPRQVKFGGDDFLIDGRLSTVLDKNSGTADRFTAEELIRDLKAKWNIQAQIGIEGTGPVLVLTHHQVPKLPQRQGYQLATSRKKLIIKSDSEDGLFYGSQTLLQLIKKDASIHIVPGIVITDWPDIEKRAVHYDTKHHQDKASYVKSFIKELAGYKINLLVWEWEDKFAYPSHPEIGAPGAFTMSEMQELTLHQAAV